MQIKFYLTLLLLVFIVACDSTPKEKEVNSKLPTAKVELANTPVPETNANLDLEESSPQLELSIWKKDANGKPIKTSPTQAFRSGDSIRVTVKTNKEGYLYLLLNGSTGSKKALYPDARINGGTNKIKADKEVTIPANGWFVFDKKPGVETVYALFALKPELKLFQQIELITNLRKYNQVGGNNSLNQANASANASTGINTSTEANNSINDTATGNIVNQTDNTNNTNNTNNTTTNTELENEVLEQLQERAKDIDYVPDSQLIANKDSNHNSNSNSTSTSITNTSNSVKVKPTAINRQDSIVSILKLYHK